MGNSKSMEGKVAQAEMKRLLNLEYIRGREAGEIVGESRAMKKMARCLDEINSQHDHIAKGDKLS